jgi:enterochelin esterase-like enzyme
MVVASLVVAAAMTLAVAHPSVGLVTQEPTQAPPAALSASRVVETTIFSPTLNFQLPYIVYLPPGYDSTEEHYPVIYMLHGLGGDRTMARTQGLFAAADYLILSGQIDPVIIVAPEGQKSYWVDHANNGPRWGTYITRDVVNETDRLYRTVPARESRAIGGISMGGHGALQLAMNSDTFGVVGAHSVALRRFEEAFPMFGDRSYFEAHDPVSLTAKDGGQARELRIWIDIGTEDIWFPAANAYHNQLVSQQIAHEWNVYPGSHNIEYWRAHAYDYLRFYDRALEKPRS